MSTDTREERMTELREIVIEVLELEDDELTETSLFIEDHDADSLRAIEILARIEKRFKIEIPQSELPKMVNLESVYNVMAQYADWQD